MTLLLNLSVTTYHRFPSCVRLQQFYKSVNLDSLMISDYCEETSSNFKIGLCQILIREFSATPACTNTTDIVLLAKRQKHFSNDIHQELQLNSCIPQSEVLHHVHVNIILYSYLFHISIPTLIIFYFSQQKHLRRR